MIGIYKITNPDNEVYIGQSVNIERRKYNYSRANCKKQPLIYNSILKHGWELHKFEIVCECFVSELNEKERFYQDFYKSIKSGLNKTSTGIRSKSGFISNDVKIKMSNAKKGVLFSENHKQSMRDNSSRKNLVLDTRNGIFHNSAKIAHKTLGGSYYTFIAKLNGRRKNDTGFLIV